MRKTLIAAVTFVMVKAAFADGNCLYHYTEDFVNDYSLSSIQKELDRYTEEINRIATENNKIKAALEANNANFVQNKNIYHAAIEMFTNLSHIEVKLIQGDSKYNTTHGSKTYTMYEVSSVDLLYFGASILPDSGNAGSFWVRKKDMNFLNASLNYAFKDFIRLQKEALGL